MKPSKTLLSIFLLIFSASLSAENISLEAAKKVAKNFIYQKIDNAKSEAEYQTRIIDSKVCTVENQALYYTFTLEKGFVLVAADDDVFPILGYSFDGKFDIDNIPPALKQWLKNYSDQIVFAKNNAIKADAKINNAWKRYSHSNMHTSKGTISCEPLIETTWDQGPFYNNMCPADDDGPDGHVLVGCVAVSMAQIMNYYKFPIHGIESGFYNSNYGYISIDFENTYYQWNYMENSLSDYNEHVAQILFHCGASVGMNYNPTFSSARIMDAAIRMNTFFRYSTDASYQNKELYNDDVWEQKVRDNLDAGHPLIYDGFSAAGGTGHAFVCDGYSDSTYFHFNWGWSGNGDGYFYLSSLTPGSYVYTYLQHAIFNIYPGENEYPYYCDAPDTLTFPTGYVYDGSFHEDYNNNSNCSWLIHSEEASSINLEFEEMNIEYGKDSIVIYDGPSQSDAILGVFSGDTLPALLQSSGNKVLIVFISDSINTAAGWKIKYSSELSAYCSSTTTLNTTSGVVGDGSGSYDYQNTSNCRWIIQAPGADSITLNFDSFKTEQDKDILRIFNKNTASLIGMYSGSSVPGPVTIPSDKVELWFISNSSKRYSGWEISYYSSFTDISENAIAESIKIFPNPASTLINIEFSDNKNSQISIELSDLYGNVLSHNTQTKGQLKHSISIEDFAPGIYILSISSGGLNYYEKVVVM